jgi:ferrous iron transport protein A
VKSASSLSDFSPGAPIALAQLRRGESGVVTDLSDAMAIDTGRSAGDSLLARLRDLGFVPGARCEVVARMWPGGDPMAVRIGGSTFALRRAEAAAVRVQPVRDASPAPQALARQRTSAAAA